MEVVRIIESEQFKKAISKLDKKYIGRMIKQIQKIKANPKVGKPMKNVRKGTRELYVNPFRLSYAYHISSNTIFLLDFYHKDRQ